MRMFLPFSVSVSVVCFFFSSCLSTRSSYYFKEVQKDTSVNVFVGKYLDLKIRKNDVVSVLVSSLDKTEDLLYNTSVSLAGGAGVVSGATSYLVDDSGDIRMHKLGAIHVEGLTVIELEAVLEKELLPYLRDPIVAANFSNNTITLLGQIGKPQVLAIPGNRINILDAFALSGDVSPTADVSNILIIRGEGDRKQFKHINLENTRFMDSSWYYLQPNDIVYISPDYKKLQQQNNKASFQQNITLVVSVISLVYILIDAVR
jgi:polysaccharide biosynthesis/export protein